jgi:phage FluMu protein Com
MGKEVKKFYKEFRCSKCDKLMFKGVLIDSKVEIKCKRCGQINLYTGELAEKFICLTENCPSRVKVN